MSSDSDFERQLQKVALLLGCPLSLIDLSVEDEPHAFAETQPAIVCTSITLVPKEPEPGPPSEDPTVVKDRDYEDGIAYIHMKTADMAGECTTFCPWKSIQTYPEAFIGKGNRPRARPYFEAILQMRDWDFFYIRDRFRPNQTFLLVPTEQFKNFLDIVNRRLNSALCIPRGKNTKRFSLCFDQCGSFRPRYLQRTNSALESEPEKKNYKFDVEDEATWPKDEGGSSDEWDALSWKSAETYLGNMKMLKSCKPDVEKLTADERATRRRGYRLKKMRDAHMWMGLDRSQTDAVLVCVDVEAIETQPDRVSEVGIAILDTTDLQGVPVGADGRPWWTFIRAHHLRVKEYSALKNYRYVQGCPDKFEFGESTFPTREEICDAIRGILSPYTDAARRVVLVGHDLGQDINYLFKLGFDMKKETNLVGKIDSQVLHQAWQESDSKRSLSAVLNDLDFEHVHLHNAGNDAVYTLRAAIGIAATTRYPSSALATKEGK